MTRKPLLAALCVVAVVLLAVAPAAATGPGQVDECKNSDAGPSDDAGPPGFVADLVPNFISDLIGSLPVPNFVKSFFGASTC